MVPWHEQYFIPESIMTASNLLAPLASVAIMATLLAPLSALAGDVSCEALIARVGLSGGLQVRMPMQSLTPKGQLTLTHLETAGAEQLSHLMADIADTLWVNGPQGRSKWAFSDIYLDGAQDWVSLRLRPQANQLEWPDACQHEQLVGAN